MITIKSKIVAACNNQTFAISTTTSSTGSVSTSLTNYLPLSGGTLIGDLDFATGRNQSIAFNTTSTGAGNSLSILGNNGASSICGGAGGAGGNIIITAGAGGATPSTAGGCVIITAGAGSCNVAGSGAVWICGGYICGMANGGCVNIVGGNGYTGGAVNICGNAGSSSGQVNIFQGTTLRLNTNTAGVCITGTLNSSVMICSPILKSDNVCGTTAFVTGFAGAGYQLLKSGTDYNLEVDNLRVRKSMNIYELNINRVSATNGALAVSVGAARISGATSLGMGCFTIGLDTSGGCIGNPFCIGDIIRVQNFNGRDVKSYFIKPYAVTSTSLSVCTISGVGTPAAGDQMVQFGSCSNTARQGLLYMTASDTNNPYLDVYSGVCTTTIDASNIKVRLGNLTGIAGASGYGLYSNNVFLTGKITANDGAIGGWCINSAYLAKDTGTAATSAGLAPSDYPFYAGSTYANRATAPFRVSNAGAVIATKFVQPYVLSNDIIYQNDAAVSTVNTTMTKVKEFNVGANVQGSITIRVKYRVTGTPATYTATARIYRNGAAVGTNRTFIIDSTYTEDIAGWVAGDLIQLYVMAAAFGGTATSYDFQILGTFNTDLSEVTTTNTYAPTANFITCNLKVNDSLILNQRCVTSTPTTITNDDTYVHANIGSAGVICLPATPVTGQMHIITNGQGYALTICAAAIWDNGSAYTSRPATIRQSWGFIYNGGAWSSLFVR